MATVAAVVALDQQAIIDAFMRTDAVQPSAAISFEPQGSIQRNLFENYTKAGIIKPAGPRWFLDVPAYEGAKRKQRFKAVAVVGLLAAVAAVLALR